MIRAIPTFATLLILSACASAPLPVLDGPTETRQASRTVFFKGVTGAQTLPPYLATRTYDVTCTTAPGDVAGRVQQTMALADKVAGRVNTQLIGMSNLEGSDARAVINAAVPTLGCTVGRPGTVKLTDDPVAVSQFVFATPGLLGELEATQ